MMRAFPSPAFPAARKRLAGPVLGALMLASCERAAVNAPQPGQAAGPATGERATGPAVPASSGPSLLLSEAAPASAAEGKDRTAKEDSLETRLSLLRERGLGQAADVIAKRAAQIGPKMKLTQDEARAAAGYVFEGTRGANALRQARELMEAMPKTAIELLRAVNERGVPAAEAERMSAYLLRLRDSMKMKNPGPFDENTSHIIGREWHEIDYSGEGMSWESQKKFYSKFGITDLKGADNLRKLFEVESKMPYFSMIYRPQGGLPQ